VTDRERFLATMQRRPSVSPPDYELGLWGQTVDRWISEGAREEEIVFDWFRGGKLGLDRREFAPVYTHSYPRFEYRVLEEDEDTVVHQDDQGVVTRSLKRGAARGTRASMDQHISHPVRDRETFLEMKKRYHPGSPERYPPNWSELTADWQQRDYPLCLQENCGFGLFSHLRIWMGTEALCVAFHEQRQLVHEMLDFLADFFCEAVLRAVREVQFEYFSFFEDFAYKAGPFTSPALFRELFLPRYRRIIEFLRAHGVQYIWLDSDGNTEVLIPLFIEMGVDCHWPLEAAAGMDPLKLQREYGRDLVLCGGIDKRALTRGREEVEAELYAKLPPLLARGGYIPTIDHTCPPDIPYANFLHYLEVKRKLMGRCVG
jgi:uroporphyrinogen decarboxylase